MSRLWKKWGILIITIFFVLLFVILGGLSMVSINKYKDAIAERDNQISSLETSLNNIGPVVTGYVVTKDVRAGELIEEEFITAVDIPEKIATNTATSLDDIIGKYYRISLSEGTVLTKEDIVEDVIDNTERKYDLIIDEWPLGLEVGDYVDIRISFPFGEDFIAMSNKKIIDINSGIPKIYVTEADISAYNSMLFDKALFGGTKIYAIEYKDAGSQANAEVFYPLRDNITELSKLNPNILEVVKQKMVLEREKLDNLIGGSLDDKDERELERLNQTIEQMRSQHNRTHAQAQKDWERRMERAAAEAARAAQ